VKPFPGHRVVVDDQDLDGGHASLCRSVVDGGPRIEGE
jgi:hypothetical protein